MIFSANTAPANRKNLQRSWGKHIWWVDVTGVLPGSIPRGCSRKGLRSWKERREHGAKLMKRAVRRENT